MRALFPSRTIAGLRNLSRFNLPDSLVPIMRGTFVPDNDGGGTYPEVEGDPLPCRTWPLSAKEMESLVAEQFRQPGLEGLVFELETEVTVTDEVVITRGETGFVDRYEVLGITPDPTYEMLRRGVIKKLRSESGS